MNGGGPKAARLKIKAYSSYGWNIRYYSEIVGEGSVSRERRSG